MQGRIDIDELKQLVANDAIETVVCAFPDMYGRLVGKRITARYFIDEIIGHGMHACDYLLACDVEMDPVPGYAFTSWAKGYGDFHPVPDFDTLRYDVTIDDPGAYTRQWSTGWTFRWVADQEMPKHFCQDNRP